MEFDLTNFMADCTDDIFCDETFYDSRYDGLAMVNYIGSTFTKISSTDTDSVVFAFCIEEDSQCIGWNFW